MKQIIEGVLLFDNDDEGYYMWLRENPNGFVVNTLKNPNSNYMKTHKATCHTITKPQNRYLSFTIDYKKYCSTDIEKLQLWAANEVKGDLQLCLKCLK